MHGYTSFTPRKASRLDPRELQGTRVLDGDVSLGPTRVGSVAFDLLDEVHALLDFTEDDVLAAAADVSTKLRTEGLGDSLQPRGLDGSDEELRTVGVGSSVGHRQQSRLGVLELEVLIGKLVAVDGLSTGTVSVGEVTALQHEVGDDSVEGGSGVAEALFTGAQGSEVGGGLKRISG
jgi:hypothetical protein